MFNFILTATIILLCFSHSAISGVAQENQIRSSPGICSTDIYNELNILAQYPPAVAFCAQSFPLKCTSAKVRRGVSPVSTATAAPAANSNIGDAKAAAYSKCLKQPVSIISTLCSCIQTPKVCPTSKTTTTTKSTSSTTSSAIAKATACSSAQTSFCTSQQQNTCLCKLDVDGITPICSNGAICPQSTFPNPPPPCGSDSDCILRYASSGYTRCVYTDIPSFCTPTYCATEEGCNQQHS